MATSMSLASTRVDAATDSRRGLRRLTSSACVVVVLTNATTALGQGFLIDEANAQAMTSETLGEPDPLVAEATFSFGTRNESASGIIAGLPSTTIDMPQVTAQGAFGSGEFSAFANSAVQMTQNGFDAVEFNFIALQRAPQMGLPGNVASLTASVGPSGLSEGATAIDGFNTPFIVTQGELNQFPGLRFAVTDDSIVVSWLRTIPANQGTTFLLSAQVDGGGVSVGQAFAFSQLSAVPSGTPINRFDLDMDGDQDQDDIDELNNQLGNLVGGGSGGGPSTPLVSVFDADPTDSVLPPSPFFDLDLDAFVGGSDLDYLIQVGFGTEYGDANLDGMVNLLDLDILGQNLGGAGGWADGDFNGDGQVNLLDLDIYGQNAGFGSATAVPEPAAAALLTLVATACAATRRR